MKHVHAHANYISWRLLAHTQQFKAPPIGIPTYMICNLKLQLCFYTFIVYCGVLRFCFLISASVFISNYMWFQNIIILDDERWIKKQICTYPWSHTINQIELKYRRNIFNSSNCFQTILIRINQHLTEIFTLLTNVVYQKENVTEKNATITFFSDKNVKNNNFKLLTDKHYLLFPS